MFEKLNKSNSKPIDGFVELSARAWWCNWEYIIEDSFRNE